jgi:hypothetical protein
MGGGWVITLIYRVKDGVREDQLGFWDMV